MIEESGEVTVIEVNGTAITDKVVLPGMPPKVAVIVVFPEKLLLVARPVVALIVAIVVLELLHVASLVLSVTEPSE